jgi:hypothetical protein
MTCPLTDPVRLDQMHLFTRLTRPPALESGHKLCLLMPATSLTVGRVEVRPVCFIIAI